MLSAARQLPLIVQRLNQAHPSARYELNFDNPLQLLVATILAAQCTDERVNRVTPPLFAQYPTARAIADADLADLETLVRATGYYRQKAKAIQNACRALVERFGGQVPRNIDDLTTLPGVARKTANVVLNMAFGIPSGVIVDTHVARVSRRLGLTEHEDGERIEQELMATLPQSDWILFGAALVLHGRYTCTARDPHCADCMLNDLCPKLGVAADEVDEPAVATPACPSSGGTAVSKLRDLVPADWRDVLADEFEKPYFAQLEAFVAAERGAHQVFPPERDLFSALRETPFQDVKVLLLGQDPYHGDGQAHGMCFSVPPGIKAPPSLVNMFKELKDDLGCKVPNNGYLVPWAKQGVLLLNAVLTVRAHEPNSHKNQGWEQFTDAIIRAVNDKKKPVVFVLWGAYAQKKEKLIDAGRHRVLKGAHPSPLSMKKFFGSRPYSAVNRVLQEFGSKPIDWQLPDV
ncbi:MAG: uracil-DNA glycosylase [Planctomycetia bacterium]|nr:uracil-DNA glycosylase [Planctomycetia bacterium]